VSYHIGERINDLKTALAACKLIHEFDPNASQRELGIVFGKPRYVWVSDKVSVKDCTDFEIVIEGDRAIFTPFKLLGKGVPIYPAGHFNLPEFIVLPFLREKKPELHKALLDTLKEL